MTDRAGAAAIPMDEAEAASSAGRVLARCDALAACTEEPGAITRPYGSAALRAAMDLVAGWMADAGMATRRDAAGNLVGRLDGPFGAPALVLGSHLDSVRDAGRYDGPLGVLLALAVAERAADTGAALPFHLDVVAFADEEGLRFHTTYLGSKAFAGAFDPALLDLLDADGATLAEACAAAGGDPAALAVGVPAPDNLLGYVEAHIEQGPALEALDAPLAVVTAIAGASRIALRFTGTAGHAGTVAMDLRHDALAAASEVVLLAELLARETDSLLATVGQLEVRPGASNVIPGEARLTLDVRSPSDATRAGATEILHAAAESSARKRGLDMEWTVMLQNPAVPLDPGLTATLAEAVHRAGHPVHELASGAGHDAVVMAPVCPTAMLFVRCAGGISHNPAESVAAPDVAAALRALTGLVALVAESRA